MAIERGLGRRCTGLPPSPQCFEDGHCRTGRFRLRLYTRIGSPEHRALARQAVRESLVLLKNENGVLPIVVDPATHRTSGALLVRAAA